MRKFFICLTALVGVFCLSLMPGLCQDKPEGLSGNVKTFTSQENCFKIDIPEEFTGKTTEGPTLEWESPIIDGMAATIYVNVVSMPGVPSKTLFDINKKQKEDDKNYVEVKAVTVKGPGEVYAFRCKEANHDNTGKQKAAGDIHRWHLLIFGMDRFYTCGFTGNWDSFQQNKLQGAFEKVISSIELIPAK